MEGFTAVLIDSLIRAEPWDSLFAAISSSSGPLLTLIGSAIVGTIGSAAYYISLRLGFTGGDQGNTIVQKFNSLVEKTVKDNPNKAKVDNPAAGVVIFLLVGAGVAASFQAAESTFTPIQSFVLGVTWPMIVSQYTSRTSAPGSDVVDKLRSRVDS